jgi:hypothetical protein
MRRVRNMATCAFGHPYDEKIYSECPWCKATRAETSGTKPVDEYWTPINLPGTSNLRKEATRTGPVEDTGNTDKKTEIIGAGQRGGRKDNERTDPVVGWLVCCEGVGKGRDYRVRFGQNLIGRGRNMDIVLDDPSVSRDCHLFIIYDHKHNNFVVQSGTSHGLVYRNEHLVTGYEELVSFDRLEIGEGKFIFVALCGKNFKWKTDKKE